MKLLLLTVLLCTPIFAAELDWNYYRTDDCNMSSRRAGDDQYGRLGLNRCKDGSVSFQQPTSSSWEGRCGHTMAANMLYTICGKIAHPVTEFGTVFRDIGSGTLPSTVTSGLNIKFRDHSDICPSISDSAWKTVGLRNADNFTRTIKSYLHPQYSTKRMNQIKRNGQIYYRNPIGVLVKNPNGELHWVTIVDQIQNYGKCHFVVNHWDNQYTIPCKILSAWAGRTQSVNPFLYKYLVIVYKK